MYHFILHPYGPSVLYKRCLGLNIYIYLTKQPIIHGDLKTMPRPIPSQCVWLSQLEPSLGKIKGFQYRNSQERQRMGTQRPGQGPAAALSNPAEPRYCLTPCRYQAQDQSATVEPEGVGSGLLQIL